MKVFLDANVPMYLVGAPHPNRTRAQQLLDQLVISETPLVTDAEVYQEVLHRYAAIGRPKMIDPAYAVLDGLVDDVFSVGRSELEEARRLVLQGVGARDALHVSTMREHQITRILTFDSGFDRFGDLERLA